ncbi:MAG: bacteriohemerythrin [Lysobacterales bacterium]
MTDISRVEWDTSLETGIEVVDEQHRRYFVLLNNYLEHAAEHPADGDQFFDLLEKFDFLRQYAKEHFSTEESLMQETRFPGYEAHRWEHRYFEHHVGELHEQLKAGGFSPQLAHDLNYYIVEWFVEHIRQVDTELVEFLHEQANREGAIASLLKKFHASLFRKS